MKQIRFGKRYAVVQNGTRTVSARAESAGDDRLRFGMLVITGIVTGFVVAAIECL